MSPAQITARRVANRLDAVAAVHRNWTPGDYAEHYQDDRPMREGMRPRYDRRRTVRNARRNDR